MIALVGHDTVAMSQRYTHVGKEALAKAAASCPSYKPSGDCRKYVDDHYSYRYQRSFSWFGYLELYRAEKYEEKRSARIPLAALP